MPATDKTGRISISISIKSQYAAKRWRLVTAALPAADGWPSHSQAGTIGVMPMSRHRMGSVTKAAHEMPQVMVKPAKRLPGSALPLAISETGEQQGGSHTRDRYGQLVCTRCSQHSVQEPSRLARWPRSVIRMKEDTLVLTGQRSGSMQVPCVGTHGIESPAGDKDF